MSLTMVGTIHIPTLVFGKQGRILPSARGIQVKQFAFRQWAIPLFENKLKQFMKIKSVGVFLFAALSAISSCAQGFVNLNFEDATIIPDPSSPFYPNAVYASDAIPGWTATGFIGPTDILYNSASLGSTSVSILGVNGTPPALDGSYSVYLYGGTT